MGVMYLYDTHQKVKAVLKDALSEWIHHEAKYTLDVAVKSGFAPRPGEYLGFECVDGRWRLFCIDKAQWDDDKQLTYVEATDAAIDDLNTIIVEDAYQENVDARTAVETLIAGTEWILGNVTAGDKTGTTDAQYVTLWAAMETVQTVLGVKVAPYYVIENGEIKGKRLDVLADAPVYRGRFFESQTDASSVVVTYKQRPYTVMYGLGKARGTEKADRMTIADVAWSKANGDPADKPAGQKWVEDAAAVAQYGRRERVMVSDNATDAAELMQLTWDALQEEIKTKVSVDAVIRDMEQIKGQKWKAVRVGDEVVVRTKAGEDVTARITDIDRDYMEPDRTKIAAGKEQTTASKQVANLARAAIHTSETLTIYRNKFLHDEALIQLNADTILSNSKEIKIVTGTLALKADKVTLEAYVKISDLETETLKVINNARVQTLKAEDFECTGGSVRSLRSEEAAIGSLTINGAQAATQSWVTGTALTPYATQAWVMGNFVQKS